jgi:peptide/nickel transport system substrate-binding protein
MIKKLFGSGMVLLTLVLVFSACSKKSADSQAENAPVKDSLTIGIGNDIQTIVPNSNNVAVLNRDGYMMFALYDTLLWRDSETGEIKPWLATAWEVSDDGLEWTFTLRNDVTFHNGDKFTAHDAAWSINLGPANPVIFLANFPTLDRAEAIDDTRLKVVLKKPFAPTPQFFASYHMGMLSKDYFDEVGGWEGYTNKPVGTGPYQFVSRTKGSNVVLRANDNYWNGAPEIKNVRVNIIPDSNSQIMTLENGEIDILLFGSIQNLVRIPADSNIEWKQRQANLCCTLTINLTSELMLDENLRKAILSGINYDGINQVVNAGYTKKANALCSPDINAMPPVDSYTPALGYDVNAAKQYLAKSSYKAGTPVRLFCISGTKEENVEKIIQGDLQAIGINAQVNAVDAASYVGASTSGNFEVSLYTVMPSLYDANLIYQLYASTVSDFDRSILPQKTELARLADATPSEMDPANRMELFRQICDLINRDAIAGYLYYDVNTIAYNKGLANVEPLAGMNYRVDGWSWGN